MCRPFRCLFRGTSSLPALRSGFALEFQPVGPRLGRDGGSICAKSNSGFSPKIPSGTGSLRFKLPDPAGICFGTKWSEAPCIVEIWSWEPENGKKPSGETERLISRRLPRFRGDCTVRRCVDPPKTRKSTQAEASGLPKPLVIRNHITEGFFHLHPRPRAGTPANRWVWTSK